MKFKVRISMSGSGTKPVPHQIPTLQDPDYIVQKKIDLRHIANMSYQMHVPDSITVGPNRSNSPHLHDDIPVRMEVPDRLRPGGNGSMVLLTDSDFNDNFYHNQETSSPTTTQQSLPSTMRQMDIEPENDDYYKSMLENQSFSQQYERTLSKTPNNSTASLSDAWHVEPYGKDNSLNLVDSNKHLIEKIQLLQNRVHQIERSLQRRDFRDRLLYSVVFGYVLIQALLSVRRSILN